MYILKYIFMDLSLFFRQVYSIYLKLIINLHFSLFFLFLAKCISIRPLFLLWIARRALSRNFGYFSKLRIVFWCSVRYAVNNNLMSRSIWIYSATIFTLTTYLKIQQLLNAFVNLLSVIGCVFLKYYLFHVFH